MGKIYYLASLQYEDYVKTNSDYKRLDSSINYYLSKECLRHLFDLQGYYKATRKILNLKLNIPIYFSQKETLYPIKDKDIKYYINYSAMLGFYREENYTVIVFEDGSILKTTIDFKRMKAQIDKCLLIIKYLKDLT